jgi:hypothetical protein
VELGDLKQWMTCTRHVVIPNVLEGTYLWVDSVDFPRQKAHGLTPRSPEWSYKENHPALRYMCLCDGRGVMRNVWGGYSPKIHDGQSFKINRHWVQANLGGATIIGDQHFSGLDKAFTDIHFHTPIRKPPKPKKKSKMKAVRVLTLEQVNYNKAVRKIRSRVERPFAWIKTRFKSLRVPWAEEEEDKCVRFAIGCYNTHKLYSHN